MIIRQMTLKNFGKFSGKDVKFSDGMNVIYGPNESGKTTLHTFLKSMLFGMERGRGRASANDTFRIYEPWDNPNFYAGILRFECGGKRFRLERNFDKYSKHASLVCETDGERLSLADGDLEMLLQGMDLASYENTIAIGQTKAETTQALATKIKDYATNCYASGNGELHLEDAVSYLRARKKEIENLSREAFLKKEHEREKLELEASYVWRDIHKNEQRMKRIEEEIAEARLEGDYDEDEKKSLEPEEKWRVHPLEVFSMLALLVLSFAVFQRPWSFLVMIVGALAEGIYVWNRMKEGKKKKYSDESNKKESPIRRLQWELEHQEEERKERQIFYGNLQEQLEELQEVSEEHKEWEKQKRALDLAEQKLRELSVDVHRRFGQKLNETSSEIMSRITGGKYTGIYMDENLRMYLNTEETQVPIDRVSRGTLEQAYFALRMAAADLLYEEELPLILDETFAFYDEERMRNVLLWMMEHKRQVLLFTCQKREVQLLRKMGIDFHLIRMEEQ